MPGLPIRSVRDPRHANHTPPSSPRCTYPEECVAVDFVALCPKCDHPVNVPRDEVVVPLVGPAGQVVGERVVREPWRLRASDPVEGQDG